MIPKTVLCAIWNKVTELLNDSESICRSPGGNTKDRIVKSTSGSSPHLVTFKKVANMHLTMNVLTGIQWECAPIPLQRHKITMILSPLFNG